MRKTVPTGTLKTLVPAALVPVAVALAVAGVIVVRAEAAASRNAGVVHTRYGEVKVERAEAVRGLDPHDLGGAAHGIAGLVQRDQVLVQVTVLVKGNGSQLDAKGFRLRAGTSLIAPVTSSLTAGKLPTGASAEGILGFVAPTGTSGLRLSVPDGTSTVDVPIQPTPVDGSPGGDDTTLQVDPNGGVSFGPDGSSTDSSTHNHG
jgi:hypothetical protein